jgi:hypothetical protein
MGAPKKPEHLKKVAFPLKLAPWLAKKIDALPGSRPVEIEKAMCQVHGWAMEGVENELGGECPVKSADRVEKQ